MCCNVVKVWMLVSVLMPVNSLTLDWSSLGKCLVKLRIYHPCDSTKFQEFCVEDGLKAFYSELYNKDNCNTVLLALPFLSTKTTYNVRPMIDVLASRCAFNIFLLDNSATTDVSVIEYPLAVHNAYKDAQRFATVLNRAIDVGLLSSRCLTVIGYSLGAQLAGHMCRNITGKCNQIYGIDPAGPLYFPPNTLFPEMNSAMQIVSKEDACRVTFLICNSGALGTFFRTAHEHVIVNGGNIQPDCVGLNVMLCSHNLCNIMMMDAITRPGACLARRKRCLNSPHLCKNEGIRNISIPTNEVCTANNEHIVEDLYMTTSSDGLCLGKKGAHRVGSWWNIFRGINDIFKI